MTNAQSGSLVSVIIAFMNEERFLAEAIQGVLSQDFTNWELILVDDGSTDNSTAIAKQFVADHPGKIRYAEHPAHVNQGLTASRNLGLSLAQGDLIAILDADDFWLPSKLRLQVDVMNSYSQVALVCEASQYWYSWNKETISKPDEVIPVGFKQDAVFSPPELAVTLYPLGNGAAPCPSAIMIRKHLLKKHSGFESQFTGKNQMYEDQAFLAKFYLNEHVYVSSACNNKYRKREGSLVQKVTNEGSYAVVRKYFLDWLQNYIIESNIHFKPVDRLLNQALEPYTQPLLYSMKQLFNRVAVKFKKLQGR